MFWPTERPDVDGKAEARGDWTLEWPEICSHTYLDDPLSMLPGVVVLSILAEDVGDEVQLL